MVLKQVVGIKSGAHVVVAGLAFKVTSVDVDDRIISLRLAFLQQQTSSSLTRLRFPQGTTLLIVEDVRLLCEDLAAGDHVMHIHHSEEARLQVGDHVRVESQGRVRDDEDH